MEIIINYPTGNHFPDGSQEIGKAVSFQVTTRADLDRALDTIPDSDYPGAFLTDADGAPVALGDLLMKLD